MGEITPNSPAARSSFKQGDIIILAVNGQPIADANQLRSKIGVMDSKATAMQRVLPDGKLQEVAVTLGGTQALHNTPGSDSLKTNRGLI